MSPLAKKPCGKLGCNVLTSARFCSDHVEQPRLSRHQFDQQRAEDPLRQLYFSETWRATRKQVLARDVLCVNCKQLATIADHMIPAKEYMRGFDPKTEEGQRRFCDESNLQGLCKHCHDSKTASETNKFRGE